MRTVIARIFDYSLDGVIATEGTRFFDFCRGGIGFWRSLIRRDLIDEYRLSLFPYLAGKGKRLFDDLGQSGRLEPISATVFGNGVTELSVRRIR